MNNNRTSTVNCPKCNNPITFDINQLIAGLRFTCNNCHAVIGMDPSSKLQIIDN